MTTATDLGLSDHQYRNLLGVVAAVQGRPGTRGKIRAAYMTVCACLAESGMQMYANRNVPTSVDYPHAPVSWSPDGLGSDHASIGMLQQQVGPSYSLPGTSTVSDTTWGTVAQLMDAHYSANKFLERLEQETWETDSLPWITIQNVQGSAYDGNPRPANNNNSEYGGNYHAQWGEALRLVNAVWGQAPSTDTSTELGGFLMALSDAEQQFILDEAKWWYSRRAKFDKMSWTVSNLANAIKGVVIGVQAIARKLGVK